MADTFQGMTEDRTAGMTRARLAQYYRDLGYSPEMAAAKAASDISNGTAPAGYTGDSPRESIAVRTANDVMARSREMNDRDLGAENIERMQQGYRSNPRLLGLDEPPAQVDQFRETPAAPGEAARGMPKFSPNPGMRKETFTALAPGENFPPRYEQQERWVMTPEAQAERDALTSNRPLTLSDMVPFRVDRDLYNRQANAEARAAQFEDQNRATSERISRELGQQPGYQAASPSLIDRGVEAVRNAQRSYEERFNPPAAQPGAGGSPGQTLPAASGEYAEPGFSGQSGQILEDAIGGSRTPPAPLPTPVKDLVARAQSVAARQAPQQAAAPAQQQAAAKPNEQNIFSRIFSAPKDPYAGQSSAQLMKTANENPDSAAAFFRADQALRKEQPDMFKARNADVPAEKRGGAVKGNAAPGKDAALHKALEIIHHMLNRMH